MQGLIMSVLHYSTVSSVCHYSIVSYFFPFSDRSLAKPKTPDCPMATGSGISSSSARRYGSLLSSHFSRYYQVINSYSKMPSNFKGRFYYWLAWFDRELIMSTELNSDKVFSLTALFKEDLRSLFNWSNSEAQSPVLKSSEIDLRIDWSLMTEGPNSEYSEPFWLAFNFVPTCGLYYN